MSRLVEVLGVLQRRLGLVVVDGLEGGKLLGTTSAIPCVGVEVARQHGVGGATTAACGGSPTR